MAYISIPNVSIKGVSLCAPKNVESIKDYELFSQAEKDRMLPFFGLDRHHVASEDICASDMCFEAAEALLKESNWEKESIDCLVVSTAAPDYIFPATACVLHNRLGLKKSCAAFDIPFGCSGWVYSFTVLASMMTSGTIKRGLLLIGDTPTRAANRRDKSAYPFFSDTGTAMLVEYEEGAVGIKAELGTFETGCDSIIMPHGGFRHPATPESFIEKEELPGVFRSMMNTHTEGTDVFSLSTNQDPLTIKNLLSSAGIEMEAIDYFAFHQTNKFLMDRVIKKMKIAKEKAPYSLEEFGNTGGCAIPLTLVTQMADDLRNKHLNIVGCALGVGISFGAVYFETNNLVIPEVVLI